MRKTFKFAIEIDGVDQFYIQEVKKPKVAVGQVTHGATNYDKKTAGGVDVANATLKKVKPSDAGDSWAWDWLNEAQNMNTGGGKLDGDYQRDVVFKELAPNGAVLNAWLWESCWVVSCDDSESKRGNKNENIIEEVVLSVDRVKKII